VHFWTVHHRRRAVHRIDVDRRRHAGPDVARGERDGTLTYSFIESVEQPIRSTYVRLLGGALFLGACSSWPTTWMKFAAKKVAVADAETPATAAALIEE
jgi:cbb3-type cytochrome oxidase subunit 1